MKKIDFHTHTISANPTKEIIGREAHRVRKLVDCAARKGLDAIVLTDFGHVFGFEIIKDNRKINGCRVFDDKYERKIADSAVILNHPTYDKPLTVFFGEEVETKQGEILACGIRNYIEPGKDISETIKETDKQGGWGIPPHSLATFPGADGLGEENLIEFIKLCEKKGYARAIETFNGNLPYIIPPFDRIPLSSRTNKLAYKLADELGEVKVGGSDARGFKFRQYERVGAVYTSLLNLDEISKDSVRDYIKNKKQTEILGGSNHFLIVSIMMSSVVIKKLLGK